MKKFVTFLIVVMIFLGSFVYIINSKGDKDQIRIVDSNQDLSYSFFDTREGVWVSDGETPYVPSDGFNHNIVWFG